MKKIESVLFTLTIFFLSSTILSAQEISKKLSIYLLMGQSNMAGRGKMTDSIRAISDPRVFMLDSNGKWVTAHHPVHFDKPTMSGVGPGLSFGMALTKKTGTAIGLVPCAVGGTSIEKWTPGAYDKATHTHPYDDAVKRIALAMKYGTIKGVIWHQGEANSSPEKAAVYLEQLAALIERVRTLTGNPNLPFVAGELGYYKNEYQNINAALKSLPQKVKQTAVVSAEGLVHKGDGVHFDAASANELGLRFAQKMLELQAR